MADSYTPLLMTGLATDRLAVGADDPEIASFRAFVRRALPGPSFDLPIADRCLTHTEWLAEGQQRFGEDRLQWRFKCPACGYVQRPIDFRPHKEAGASADTAMLKCLGRFWRCKRRAFGFGSSEDGGPCDYTSAGLLNINPLTLVMEDGSRHRVFEFAD